MFFSSHQIAEVEQIADRVAIIDRGRAVVTGALDDLREQLPPHPAGVRRRRARRRRSARPASSACGARAACSRCCRAPAPTRVVDEARALNPVSVDVAPVTLKEIFLETVAAED